jgi:alpha-ketoglutarate-dependent taurine dioxygenase
VSDIDIRKIGGRIGAEVVGVDLKSDLSDGLSAELGEALVEHKVLFFREQHLDDAAQLAFAARFGPLKDRHPTMRAADGKPQVLPVDAEDQRANHWHVDVSFGPRPPKASTLRGIVIPPYGGNTLVANAEAAYKDLPKELRAIADGLWAVHTNHAEQPILATERALEYRKAFLSRTLKAAHPVVRVHPDSGEPALFLGGFAQTLVGLTLRESRPILDVLQSYVIRPENIARWRWTPGDVLIFDNRNTQHYAPDDFDGLPRLLHRVSVTGDETVGLDGRTSYVVQDEETAVGAPATI